MNALEIDLTKEQRKVMNHLLRSRKKIQTMGGYAGTGKTTLIRYLKERLPGYVVCAFTGKAASVLRSKGMEASTIHSLIYAPAGDEDDPEWILLPPERLGCSGFIVDEASMVGKALHDDLASYGLPMICVGDHGQLPPVDPGTGDEPFNLMAHPDVVLETIHRNAGPIARFAEWLRKDRGPRDWLRHARRSDSDQAGSMSTSHLSPSGGHRVTLLDLGALNDWDLVIAQDQIVCAYNKTRTFVNRVVREALGRGELPEVGDRLMCLKNDKKQLLFNGMQGVVAAVGKGERLILDYGEEGTREVRYIAEALDGGNWKGFSVPKGHLPFDWCWAVTCHKAQGSEWDRVMVIEERCDLWEARRWNYTAASRAKEQLCWICTE